MNAVARLAVAWTALAAAIYLAPASVQIAAWPASGPVRIAFLPPLVRLWAALAGVGVALTVAVVLWRRSGRGLDDLSRRLAPLGLLLLWTVPFLPWLADRAPILVMLAGPVRWVIAAAAASACAATFWSRRELQIGFLARAAVVVVSVAVYAA